MTPTDLPAVKETKNQCHQGSTTKRSFLFRGFDVTDNLPCSIIPPSPSMRERPPPLYVLLSLMTADSVQLKGERQRILPWHHTRILPAAQGKRTDRYPLWKCAWAFLQLEKPDSKHCRVHTIYTTERDSEQGTVTPEEMIFALHS